MGRGGSLMQYCACPGPSEVTTVDFASRMVWIQGRSRQFGCKLACIIFKTLKPIPKSYQLTMMYEKKFFKKRGLVRCDVGTKRFPTQRKKLAGKAPWARR